MFDYSLLHWTTFVTATMLLNLSPGPDMAFMIGQTLTNGRASGFAAMFGMWLAAACHALIAALGLSAILVASASAFMVMKWVGAIYLIWLGIQSLRSRGASFSTDDQAVTASKASVFRQGFFVSLLNPKVALFFLAFLPQFVVPGAGSTQAQLLLHGLLVIVISGVVEPPIIFLADYLSVRFRKSRTVGQWLDRCLGGILIWLGIRLAMTER